MLTFECHGRIQYCAKEMQASYLPKSAKFSAKFRCFCCYTVGEIYIQEVYIPLLLTIVLLLPVARRFRPHATCTSPIIHLIMNKFIRQNFVSVTSFKTLISRRVESCLDKVLHRHCGMIKVQDQGWQTALYGNA